MGFQLTTYTEEEIFEEIILKIVNDYPETKWFASDKVAITHEKPEGNSGPSWTEKLVSRGLIEMPQGNQDEIKKYVELERMLSSIVYFHLFYDGSEAAYKKLTSLQKPNEKLTESNFAKVHQLMREVAKNEETYNAVVAMLVYSDLGKAPQIRLKATAFKEELGRNYPDHDDFIEAVLNLPRNEIPHIIPSYFSLPKDSKEIIANVASAMKVHFGHVLHIEGGEKMFQKFHEAVKANKVTPDVLDFAFIIQLADVAAAAGQVTNAGSLTLTDATCRGYFLVKSCLQEIAEGISIRAALNHYLQQRGEWLGITINDERKAVLVRLGCMLRYYDPEGVTFLGQYAAELSDDDWAILIQQFNLEDGFNAWKRNPTYLPAVLLNIAKAGGNPVVAAACIARLFAYCAESGLAASDNPLCLNTLAGIASREPNLFTAAQFRVEDFAIDEQNNIVKRSVVSEKKLATL